MLERAEVTDKMDGMGIHRRSNRRRRGGKTAAVMRDAGAMAEEEEKEKETKSIDVITDEDSTSLQTSSRPRPGKRWRELRLRNPCTFSLSAPRPPGRPRGERPNAKTVSSD